SGLGCVARRVRWRQAGRVGAAWLVTLPLSIGVAAGVAAGLRELL
ncbi:MAG: inorganic phosphate transporter, partial [Catenulispora sp.]|nr:inorganic phosphate transporter [Catenulispora sp.]